MYLRRARMPWKHSKIYLEAPAASLTAARVTKTCTRANSWAVTIAAIGFILSAFAGNVHALEPVKPTLQALPAVTEQAILPQMDLDQALQVFEKNYRTPESLDRFHKLDLEGAQTLIKDLSVLNAKFYVSSENATSNISLHPAIFPVPVSPKKLISWKRKLPPRIKPPEISHQTFAVSLNGKAYVIAPGHGVRGDKRYSIPPKSDSAVRRATTEEAKQAFSLDRRPSQLPGKIVMLEGKLPTGETVRFQCASVRGLEPLQALLPDPRISFHNWRRGVEVHYERTQIFILPPEWSKPNRLRLHRAIGFSGAPAIEKMPEGDAVAGQFIGYRAVTIGSTKFTLGILADYEAIRTAVESFAATADNEVN
jgi:hypothetical protein